MFQRIFSARVGETDVIVRRFVCRVIVCLPVVFFLGHSTARAQCQLADGTKFAATDAYFESHFGRSISVDEDVAAVGTDAEAAYLFRLTGGAWVQEAKLTLHVATFGSSVSVNGDVVVVGAWGDDSGGNCPGSNGDCGSAYIYRLNRNTNSWRYETKLPYHESYGNNFGLSVSNSGNLAVVGAPGELCSLGGSLCGAAYVYRYSNGGWVREARLEASDASTELFFGRGVAVSGNVAVIGSNRSTAYVFRYNGSTWVEEKKLTNSDGARPADSVGIDGDTIIVGTNRPDCSLGNDTKAVYIFRHEGSDWVEQARLTVFGPTIGRRCFGGPVSVDGDLAVAGAREDCASGVACGAAYVFRLDESGWQPRAKLLGEFGTSVSVSSNVVVIGAPGDDCSHGHDCGAAFAYTFANTDCNANGTTDDCDIAEATSDDCNTNSVPDECEIAGCDGNPACADCDENGVPDGCDIDSCQANHPDCDDCNANLTPDACDIRASLSEDKNANGIPDECEKCLFDADCINGLFCDGEETCENSSCSPGRFPCGSGESCDDEADECFADCNRNNVRDETDIAVGTSDDCDDDQLPDDCESDEDSDGVIDACDLCLGTPSAMIVDADGCLVPVGACCFDSAVCIGSVNPGDCKLVGGHYLGDGATCDVDHDGDDSVGCDDQCPLDQGKTIPGACGCGVADTDSDFDGASDCIDACPDDGLKVEPGVCGCGVDDTDTDGDGALDCVDPCPFDDPDDTDGDGVCDHNDRCPLDFADDLDGDGVCDSRDGCPFDAEKLTPGPCGCGVPDEDTDGDGVADCNDLCSGSTSTQPINMCGCPAWGACCFTVGVCFTDLRFESCDAIGGTYQGDGTQCADGCRPGSFDFADFSLFLGCMAGPASLASDDCLAMDFDRCRMVDLHDFAVFLQAFEAK